MILYVILISCQKISIKSTSVRLVWANSFLVMRLFELSSNMKVNRLANDFDPNF